MKFTPTEPQRLAHQHLWANDRAALFMGCGLGKTATCLQLIEDLFIDGATNGIFVVAPLRVVNLTWPAEVAKWENFRWLKVANLRTSEGWAALEAGSAHIYTINYDLLLQFRDRYLRGRRSLAFDTVIWDEITKAKSPTSKRINGVRKYLQAYCRRHYGLTGTPSPNSLLDLFAQIRLLDGGERLGKSYHQFRRTYFEPVDYYERKWEPLEGSRERIYKRLNGFALTLRSSDWLQIPDVTMEDVEVTLPPAVKAMYKSLERELFLTVNGTHNVIAANAAVLVNKLLQVTSGAIYINGEQEARRFQVLHKAKIDALQKLLKRFTLPTMVFCTYRHEQERLRKIYPQAEFFQDARSRTEQEEIVARWNARRIGILIANPASLGHGLNLQGVGAANIVWLSLPWSREIYDQAIARLARLGQEEATTVYRLLTRETVDYAVAEALRAKEDEQSALLQALTTFCKKV